MSERRSLSRFHAIGLNLALIALPCALYFFVYVEAQRSRVATREFQVLADVGTELSRQLRTLSGIVQWGEFNDDRVKQLRKLPMYRGLRWEEKANRGRVPIELSVADDRAGTTLTLSGPQFRPGKSVNVSVAFRDVTIPLENLIETGRALEFFDELLVVDESGRVRHRDGIAAIHLEDVSDLTRRVRASRANAAADKDRGAGSAPTALSSGETGEPFLEKLALGDVKYLIFGQPWRPPYATRAPEKRAGDSGSEAVEPGVWTIVGLARTSRFNGEVTGVREPVMAAALAALLLGVLSWPWLKLWLIGPRERLRAMDAHFVAIALVVGAMLTTLVLLGVASYQIDRDKLDNLQLEVAKEIRKRVLAELSEARAALDAVPADLDWKASKRAGAPPSQHETRAFPDYEVAFAVNERGAVIGTPVNRRAIGTFPPWVGEREYFRSALNGSAFAAERVRGGDTGEKITAFARNARLTHAKLKDARVVGLGRMMLSLQAAVLPEHFGYAVFDRSSGDVLFHSDDRRSLVENLSAATHHAADVKQVMAGSRRRFVDVEYGGRPHRMLFLKSGRSGGAQAATEPDAAAELMPTWGILVFRDAVLLDRLTYQTLFLSACALALYTLLLVAAANVARVVVGWEKFWSWIWPQRGYEWRYACVSLALGALIAIGLLGIGPILESEQAPWWSTLILLLAPPLFGVTLGFLALSLRPRSLSSEALRAMLLLICVAGVAFIIGEVQSSESTKGPLVWIPAGLLLMATVGALMAPRNAIPTPGLSRLAFLTAGFLGLVVIAVLPSVVVFRDARLLELDSLRALEHRKARDGLDEREAELLRQRARLTNKFAAHPLRASSEFARGVFVPATPEGGLKELDAERSTLRLARRMRLALPGIHMKPRTRLSTEDPAREEMQLRSADWLAADSWWRPTGGSGLALAFAAIAATAIGWLLTRSASRWILGLATLETGAPLRTQSAAVWVKSWEAEKPKTSNLFVQAPRSFIRLLHAELIGQFGERGVAWIDLPLPAEESSQPEAAFARRLGDQARVVVVEDLEMAMLQPVVRARLLEFLEHVAVRRKLPILLTSDGFTLRQITHSDGLPEDARGAESDALMRWSELLATFRKQPMKRDVDAPRLAALGRDVLKREAQVSEEVFALATQLEGSGIDASIGDDEVIDALADLAEAHYRRIWSLCTQEERLVLVHLARGHLVNPRNAATLEQLLRRGLVIRGPALQPMNESFARFAARAEPDAEVEKWEKEGSESPWVELRPTVLVVLALGGVFVAYLGLETLNPVLALVPILAGAIPSLSRVAAVLPAGKGDSPLAS